MRKFIVGCFLLILSINNYAQNGTDFFNNSNELFQKYVVAGKVDYANLKSDSQLDELVKAIAITDISKHSIIEKKAFYINAYNLLVINLIVKK